MASNDTLTAPNRPLRAETPPADYWQRWSVRNAPPTEAVQAQLKPEGGAAAMASDVGDDTPYRVLIV